ncbi:MAG: YeiH family protein, partial [Lachnospiraceae bacterium]
FDMAMILLFPFMGRAMGLSDMAYGLWSGTAINDTSSVVAAGYAFSEAAGDFATMVKLTRTLSIIPAVIIFALIEVNLKKKAALANAGDSSVRSHVRFLPLFPWFILGFLLLALTNSFGLIPTQIAQLTKSASKFLMVSSLAAIGLGTGLGEMRKSGIRPMIHGFIISALVVLVAILVEWCMGLV